MIYPRGGQWRTGTSILAEGRTRSEGVSTIGKRGRGGGTAGMARMSNHHPSTEIVTADEWHPGQKQSLSGPARSATVSVEAGDGTVRFSQYPPDSVGPRSTSAPTLVRIQEKSDRFKLLPPRPRHWIGYGTDGAMDWSVAAPGALPVHPSWAAPPS